MSTPRWNAFSCGPYAIPPATRARLRPWVRASGANTSATWSASSRVGTRTRERAQPDGAAEPVSVVIMGRPKPSVLPEPVRPRPSTSRPASASGMVADWIGKGSVMPAPASADTRPFGTPRPANPPDVGRATGAEATLASGACQLIWSASPARSSRGRSLRERSVRGRSLRGRSGPRSVRVRSVRSKRSLRPRTVGPLEAVTCPRTVDPLEAVTRPRTVVALGGGMSPARAPARRAALVAAFGSRPTLLAGSVGLGVLGWGVLGGIDSGAHRRTRRLAGHRVLTSGPWWALIRHVNGLEFARPVGDEPQCQLRHRVVRDDRSPTRKLDSISLRPASGPRETLSDRCTLFLDRHHVHVVPIQEGGASVGGAYRLRAARRGPGRAACPAPR